MLKGKRIILGISGGIAAYKSLFLIRLFKKNGADVRVVLTNNALHFVTKVTLESLSQNKVYFDVFSNENDYTTAHVSLTDWGDIFVVAPATANIIGKFANGIADDALSTSLIAFDKKVLLAPAMNCKMLQHFSVQNNITFLQEQGVHFIDATEGYLACGYEGKGRMAEPEAIFAETINLVSGGALKNKKVLITAGPTYEAIDPVRFIGNHSSGYMGICLAESFANEGAEVTLVLGPSKYNVSHPHIKTIPVVNADEMFDASFKAFSETDICIMSAAVSDFKPAHYSKQKIKKNDAEIELNLIKNKDILKSLGQSKKTHQILVGFALETDNEIENAHKKLIEKNLDFIVMNSLNDLGAGFGYKTNKITIIDRNSQEEFPLQDKKSVALNIVKKTISLIQNK